MITKEDLLQLFEYKNGVLYWKHRRHGVKKSMLAGTINEGGRWCIKVNGKTILAHRLIWIMFHGEIPKGREIDHKDRNPLNNLISNLRLANRCNNQHNTTIRQANTSGYKGVNFRSDSKKWRARICLDNKRIQLGNFNSAEEAHEAYKKAAIQYHGEFANFS